jgi:hypothetical protein
VGLLSPILRNGAEGRLTWWCPGCDGPHGITIGKKTKPEDQRWRWNGDAFRPTFEPSVLVTWDEPQWSCDHMTQLGKIAKRCHSFVRAGRMQFLDDCTHELKGQTVEIPPWPIADWKDL